MHVLGLLRERFVGVGEAAGLRRRLLGCYPIGAVVPTPPRHPRPQATPN
jgi:hypothetical protein